MVKASDKPSAIGGSHWYEVVSPSVPFPFKPVYYHIYPNGWGKFNIFNKGIRVQNREL